jgi:hypothetical protein
MYESVCVLVLTWKVYSDLVDRSGNTANLYLRGARLPIVLTVSYAFPKAYQVSPDVGKTSLLHFTAVPF